MPVYILERDMPYTELLKWIEYFRKRPIGWREDHRTSMLLKAQGVKGKPQDLFQSLAVIEAEAEKAKKNDQALPKGKFLNMMLKAKGGDSSGWKPNWRK
jgi:hypothetical protein